MILYTLQIFNWLKCWKCLDIYSKKFNVNLSIINGPFLGHDFKVDLIIYVSIKKLDLIRKQPYLDKEYLLPLVLHLVFERDLEIILTKIRLQNSTLTLIKSHADPWKLNQFKRYQIFFPQLTIHNNNYEF